MVSSNIEEVGQEDNKWQEEIFTKKYLGSIISYRMMNRRGFASYTIAKMRQLCETSVGHTDVTNVDQSFYHKYMISNNEYTLS